VIFQLLKYVKLFSFQKSCRLNTFPSLSMYLNIRGSIYDTAATNIRLSVRDWYIRMYKRRARLHWLRSIQSETNEISTLNVTLAYKKKM